MARLRFLRPKNGISAINRMTVMLTKPGKPRAAERRHALGQRFSPEQSFDRLFEDMGDEEEDRQEEAFIEDRIDQRPLAKPASGVKDLEQHHDFGEDEGVDEGESLHGEIDPMLAQDHALIEHKNAEQNPEIEEEHEEPAKLVGRLGL